MFGSFKIIQTFHRVWTTRELQPFSKYTKCVHYLDRAVWAEGQQWKSTAQGNFYLSLYKLTGHEVHVTSQPWCLSKSNGKVTDTAPSWEPRALAAVTVKSVYLPPRPRILQGRSLSVTVERHPARGTHPTRGPPSPPCLRDTQSRGPALQGSHRQGPQNDTTSQIHRPKPSIFCLLI